MFVFLDPPSEVLVPSEEITTEIDNNTTFESITTSIIETTTTLMPTVTTLMPTVTTIATSPITTLALVNKAQIHDKATTTPKMINYSHRTKNLTTYHWLKSYHTTTERVKVNYIDRSKLDLCDGFYDAITMYKGILFIFKGQVCVLVGFVI